MAVRVEDLSEEVRRRLIVQHPELGVMLQETVTTKVVEPRSTSKLEQLQDDGFRLLAEIRDLEKRTEEIKKPPCGFPWIRVLGMTVLVLYLLEVLIRNGSFD